MAARACDTAPSMAPKMNMLQVRPFAAITAPVSMNLFWLLTILLVPVVLGLTLTVTGLRDDLRLRRGTPYCQRGPARRQEDSA
jgi:hypothetical protein